MITIFPRLHVLDAVLMPGGVDVIRSRRLQNSTFKLTPVLLLTPGTQHTICWLMPRCLIEEIRYSLIIIICLLPMIGAHYDFCDIKFCESSGSFQLCVWGLAFKHILIFTYLAKEINFLVALVCLFVCVPVWQQYYAQTCEWIAIQFHGMVRGDKRNVNFGGKSGSRCWLMTLKFAHYSTFIHEWILKFSW